jgi:hypothetical protein
MTANVFIATLTDAITDAVIRDLEAARHPNLDLVDLVNFHIDMYPDPMPVWFNTLWYLILETRIYTTLELDHDYL